MGHCIHATGSAAQGEGRLAENPGVIEQQAVDVMAAVERLTLPDSGWDQEDAVSAYLLLLEAKSALAMAVEDLGDTIAHAMNGKRETISGVTLERHAKAPRRTNWEHDDLLRVVVDSRIVDQDTGEIASTLEVLKKVYPLKGYNARSTALRALGIDVDEFCQTESTDRMTVRIHN